MLSFSAIAEFFKHDLAQLQRGENSYESGNIAKMIFDPEVSPVLLKGEVKASMKSKNYTVEISIDWDDGIIDAKCTCPRGQAICQHMAALCIHAHHNISVTDKACSWTKRKLEVESITKIADVYQPKRANYQAVQRQANQDEISNFREELGSANPVGFTWYLLPEPLARSDWIPSIEEIIFSEEYIKAQNKEEFFLEKCSVTETTVAQVHSKTIGQASNENWLIARKYRLTSSKFGPVIAACKRNKYPKSLFKNLLEGYDLSGIQALQWGKENENLAIQKFTEITGLDVAPAGLYLEKSGFLGTSPDGYISERCLIEVKCPFKFRNEKILQEVLTKKNYIVFYENNEIVLNENHNYYHQIQGALHITNKDMCYLVVWIPNDILIVRISKDEEWKENIDILKSFYLKHFLTFITS